MDMDQGTTTITQTASAESATKTAVSTPATATAAATTTTKNIGTNTPSIESETSTTTISMVSSNTNPFMPRISKNNPFSVSTNNNRMDTETKGTSTKYINTNNDDDNEGTENIDNRTVTNNRSNSMVDTKIVHHQYQQTAQTHREPGTESHTKSTMVDDLEINSLNCCSVSSLPRKFERLNLSTSLSTDSEIITTASKLTTNKSNTNRQDYTEADEHVCIHVDQDDVDADVDDDDDSRRRARVRRQIHSICGPKRGEVLQTKSEEDDRDEARGRVQPIGMMKHSKSELTASTIHSPPKGMIPKIQATIDSRPIYPNVPYSPYGSPFGSPRSNRRRTPLRESRRISIEQSGSFLQLNQYKLMDQIGQGSYGLVKLAYSEEDSTHYAMKILSKRRLLRKAGLMGRGPKRTTSPLDRVYREIAVLKKLDHPNVVKLIEVLDDPLEDSLYLVFELVQQGEVLGIPADCPLSEERAWSVFRDALQGLEYLHYQRIIHADIKPGNLLLAECGRVKIADLGVCNEFLGEDATMNNGSTAGTPAFRAPETLIPGQHLYSGKAADIWALGATLYALVYGNVPFVAKSVPALYEKIKHDQLKFPEYPKITNELRDLIEKILTKDPSKRITLPQIKEHNWVTSNGAYPLPSEEENCRLVQISDEDIHSVVKSIPKLDTLILIKTMLKNHSFQNPFSRGSISGHAPQRGGSRLERFTRAGRSNSAPGAYHLTERQLSSENILPSVSEGVASSCNESSDQSADG